MKPLTVFLTITLIITSPTPLFSETIDKASAVIIPISIGQVRFIAINNSLDIKLAKLDSKIKGTELSYQEGIFDTYLNASIDYADDQTKRSSSLYGTKNLTNNYNIGLSKKLKTGTDVSVDLNNKREWTDSSSVSTNPYHESAVEVSVTQPIAKNFFGLIDRSELEIIKEEINNAELESYIKIEKFLIEADKAYWGLVLAHEEYKAVKEMLKKSIMLFNHYRKKLSIGLVETGDMLAVEANMHKRASDLLIAYNKVRSAEELLQVKLNMDHTIRLYPAEGFNVELTATSLEKSLISAFNNRRDYSQYKNNITAKKIKLKMKSNSRFPELDLKTTFTTNGIDPKYNQAIQDVLEDSNPKYFVGLEFSYPLENNTANSEYEKAMLEKTKALLELQKNERDIISDVDEKFRDLAVSKATIAHMERVQNLQKGKLLYEEKRFIYGRSASDTLIRYQEDLLNSKLETQKTYYNYIISFLRLKDSEDSYLNYIGLE
ncbi:MAG: TolC family protein [Candidatus Omnitrophota bacterium]